MALIYIKISKSQCSVFDINFTKTAAAYWIGKLWRNVGFLTLAQHYKNLLNELTNKL